MLTQTSKYALRILVHLVGAREDGFVLGTALSKQASVPANYLSKILWSLRNAGLVHTARGHKGGYRLKVDANTIRLVDVVSIFEGIQTRPSCVLGIHEDCSDEKPCSAHHLFRNVRRTYVEFLENTTVAEVARKENLSAIPEVTASLN